MHPGDQVPVAGQKDHARLRPACAQYVVRPPRSHATPTRAARRCVPPARAAHEHCLRALRLFGDAVAQCLAGLVPGGGLSDIGLADAMACQRLLRQIQPTPAPVDGRILQKIDQLKRAADLIRQRAVVFGELSGQFEDQLPDRIGRPVAVIEQGRDIRVAVRLDILLEGRQQRFEAAPVELVGDDMRHQTSHPGRLRGSARARKANIVLELG